MKLLIDAGNTRIKWALVHDGAWISDGALEHAEADSLGSILDRHPALQSALGLNVAGEALGTRLEACVKARGVTLNWLTSSAYRCGVTNLYHDPAQLGADRWAALIGARSLHASTCVVVCAGTATTVDLLDATGQFQGGLILPGEHLMRQSLARDTARLPLADGQPSDPPRSTVDAIVTGCLYAQAGAIERFYAHATSAPQALCLLSGGSASRIAPLLNIPHRHVENLVLRGLAIASEPS